MARETQDEKAAALLNKTSRKLTILRYSVNRVKDGSSLENVKSSSYNYIMDVKTMGVPAYSYLDSKRFDADEDRYNNIIKNFEKIHNQGMKIFAKKLKNDYKTDPVVRSYNEAQIIKILKPLYVKLEEYNSCITITSFEAEEAVVGKPDAILKDDTILFGKVIQIKFLYNPDGKTLDDVSYTITNTRSEGIEVI